MNSLLNARGAVLVIAVFAGLLFGARTAWTQGVPGEDRIDGGPPVDHNDDIRLPPELPAATVGGEVYGSVLVRASGAWKAVHDADVWLEDVATGDRTPNVQSDCRGLYTAAAGPVGTYRVCASYSGFNTACRGPFTLADSDHYAEPLRLTPSIGVTVLSGVVTLAGGSPAVKYQPRFDEVEYAAVEAVYGASRIRNRAVSSCSGDWVMGVPALAQRVALTAEYAGNRLNKQYFVPRERPIRERPIRERPPRTGPGQDGDIREPSLSPEEAGPIRPGGGRSGDRAERPAAAGCGGGSARPSSQGYEARTTATSIDFVFTNSRPSVTGTLLERDGEAVRWVGPGEQINLLVFADDPDGGAAPELRLRPDGWGDLNRAQVTARRLNVRTGPSTGYVYAVPINLPDAEESHTVEFLIDDGDGGVIYGSHLISTGREKKLVAGEVVDARERRGIPGAEVRVNGQRTRTDREGFFAIFLDEEPERTLITIKRPGYALYSRSTSAPLMLGTYELQRAERQSADPDQDFEMAADGATLQIPANSLVRPDGSPALGPVTVQMFRYDPLDPTRQLPAGLRGRNLRGEIVPLRTLGAVDVEVTDADGTELNLDGSAPAFLRIPAAEEHLAAGAPGTVPLWYLNEEEGIWEEEGSFELAGRFYEAEVEHFSTINIDIDGSGPGTCVRIRRSTLAGNLVTTPYGLQITVDPGGLAVVFQTIMSDDLGALTEVEEGVPHTLQVIEILGGGSFGGPIGPPINSPGWTGTVPNALQGVYPYVDCPSEELIEILDIADPDDIVTANINEWFLTMPSEARIPPGENPQAVASAYYSFIDSSPVVPGGVTISTAGIDVTGSAPFSGIVPGDLIRPTAVGSGAIQLTCVDPANCFVLDVTAGVLVAGDLLPGDIIEILGQKRIVKEIDLTSGPQTVTVTSLFDPSGPVIAGETYTRSEVRVVVTVSGVDIDVNFPFNRVYSGSNFDVIGDKPNLASFVGNNDFPTYPEDDPANYIGAFLAGVDAETAYFNAPDLEFDRWMIMKKGTGVNNALDEVAYAVSNYDDIGHIKLVRNLLAAGTITDTEFLRVATVTMEHSREPGGAGDRYTKFYVYDGPTGRRLPDADLDGYGAKEIPGLCIVCHAGDWKRMDSDGNLGGESAFIAFDIESFGYPDTSGPFSDLGQLAEFKAMNEAICTNTNVTPVTEELIAGWYSSTCAPGFTLTGSYNANFVASGWTGSTTEAELYERVIRRSCRACHSTRNPASSPGNGPDFATFGDAFGASYAACDDFSTGAGYYMPQAVVTWDNFWNSFPIHEPAQLVAAGVTTTCEPPP